LRQAADFIRNEVQHSLHQYIVRYLHVPRPDEFDYRRLYANWLAASLPRSLVALSFEQFRVLVNATLFDKAE
jgi:hypothetical protein